MVTNARAKVSNNAGDVRRGLTLVEFVLVALIVVVVAAFLLPAQRRSREGARRSQSKNNLKQIWIALNQYEAEHHALPPAYTVDANGLPLHSWRTLILPYLDQKALYNKIDLTKPWNDPVHADAFKSSVPAYRCPSMTGPETHTTYLAVVTPDSCLRPAEPRRVSEIVDGTAKTVLVVEFSQDHAVHWMSPTDADESMFLKLGGQPNLPHTGGTYAAFADGIIHFLNAATPNEQRRAMITISGKEPLGDF